MTNKKRKICVVTTSRADYGHLRWLMKEIDSDRDLNLQIIASGMHLEPIFGLTCKMITEDGLHVSSKIKMSMCDDSKAGIAKSIALGLCGFTKAYKDLAPDIVVLLGDRFELLAAAISALISGIPIAHIHGGETTQGAIDEAVRHSITKMASVHFPVMDLYRKRILQMGESPNKVFNLGAPGLDNIYKLKMNDKNTLQRDLKFTFKGKIAIVTYHPVTMEKNTSFSQIRNILAAIEELNIQAIFTMANADMGGHIINTEVQKFCLKHPDKYKFLKNLGYHHYLSCLKNFDVMVGNSSSGLLEAAAFKIPVVNIGDRQKGRFRPKNVVDTGYSSTAIKKGIRLALSREFHASIRNMRNPYKKFADGRASFRIKERLKAIDFNDLLMKKRFHDIGDRRNQRTVKK